MKKNTAIKLLAWVFIMSIVAALLASCHKDKQHKGTISIYAYDAAGGVTVEYWSDGGKKMIASCTNRIPFNTEVPVSSNGSLNVRATSWGGCSKYKVSAYITKPDGSIVSHFKDTRSGEDIRIKVKP